MSDTAETPQDTSIAGVERLRETAKWLIGAYAAVGTAIIAGLQLTSLGKVEEEARFWVGATTAAVALVAVVVGIYFVAEVLAPVEVETDDLDESSAAERETQRDPTLLKGQATSLADLRKKYTDALGELEIRREAIKGPFALPAEREVAKEAAAEVEARIALLLTPLEGIRRRIIFEKVQLSYNRAKRMLGAMGLVVIISVIAFAWAANPSDESQASAKEAKDGPMLTTPSTVAVTVSRVRPSLAALRERLGPNCDLSEVPALTVGGTAAAPEVVTLPEHNCNVTRFTATQNIGIVLPSKH